MQKKISFIRLGAESADKNSIKVKTYEEIIKEFSESCCKGNLEEIIFDNVICLGRPDVFKDLLLIIKPYLSNSGELVICDLGLSMFCDAVCKYFLSDEEAPKALYGRTHVYNVLEVCLFLESSGFKIKYKKIDNLSFIIKCSLKDS